MEFVDTHCHIHFEDYKIDPIQALAEAKNRGVTRLICVGCSLSDSKAGVKFANDNDCVWASIGIHPHDSKDYVNSHDLLKEFALLATKPKVVAIGETGLDYYYNHSPKKDQIKILEFQLDLASKHKLPVIFHVREAFDDFWPIIDNFNGIRGVIHSFTANRNVLDKVLEKGLYIGLNGIMTFTKDNEQLSVAKSVPSANLLLETDAPFLTPAPERGTICQPKHAVLTAEFLAGLREENLVDLAKTTTQNACNLFGLK